MLVENAEFAREAAEGIERLMAPDNSWRVALDGDDRLTWTNDAETTHRQPARNVGQRIADKVFEILPIDRYI
jgi:putative cardiolipin synthase